MNRTRAQKLVALAKMRQDWRDVNDCINDDLTELKVERVKSLKEVIAEQTINMPIGMQSWSLPLPSNIEWVISAYSMRKRIQHRSSNTSAYDHYLNKQYAFKRERYEKAIQWGDKTLLDLKWLSEEIINLEKELYY